MPTQGVSELWTLLHLPSHPPDPLQLLVQFNMQVVCSVTTISPRLGRPERPFRDLQYHFPSLCALDRHKPAMQRSHARTLRVMCCPTSFSDGVALRPSIAVDFPLHRSVSCSCSQKRWPVSARSRSLVRLAAGTPSFVAVESPTLAVLKPSVGNSSTHC